MTNFWRQLTFGFRGDFGGRFHIHCLLRTGVQVGNDGGQQECHQQYELHGVGVWRQNITCFLERQRTSLHHKQTTRNNKGLHIIEQGHWYTTRAIGGKNQSSNFTHESTTLEEVDKSKWTRRKRTIRENFTKKYARGTLHGHKHIVGTSTNEKKTIS